MMKDSLKYLKMAKYGFNVKSSMLLGLMFFVLGIIMMCVPTSDTNSTTEFLGCLYIVVGPMMILQVINTNLMASLVLSSPKRPTIELTMPNTLAGIISGVTYTVLVVMNVVRVNILAGSTMAISQQKLGIQLLLSAILMGMLCLYMAIVYKKYFVAMIVFIICLTTFVSGFGDNDVLMLMVCDKFTLIHYIAIGYGILIVGNVCGMIARKILYKQPMSKFAMGAFARRMR